MTMATQEDGKASLTHRISVAEWVGTCARRVCELDPSVEHHVSVDLAVELFYRHGSMHPVAAAERRVSNPSLPDDRE
jgi:hypothetical protein